MKKKEISRGEFLKQIRPFTLRDELPDYEKHFIIRGGRGFITVLQKIFNEQLERPLNQLNSVVDSSITRAEDGKIKSGHMTSNVFIIGIGMLEIEYDATYDNIASLEDRNEIIGGLPECCYSGMMFVKGEDNAIGTLTTLMEAPFENVEELVKSIKADIWRMKDKLDDYLKELENI